MRILVTVFAFASMVMIANAQDNLTWHKKIDSALLEKMEKSAAFQFLVLMVEQADLEATRSIPSKEEKAAFVFNKLKEVAQVSQRKPIELLEHRNAVFQSFFIINAIAVTGNADLVEALAKLPEVALVMANPAIRFDGPVEMQHEGVQERGAVEWGIEMINANDVWELGYRGQGVSVGGQDTGYDWSHPALIDKYRGYETFVDTFNHNFNWHDAIHVISPLANDSLNPCGLNLEYPCDDNGHGTHTMGTMVGSHGENEIGVAPDAKWCACRNMERGNGSPFTYLECFQWFLAPTDLNGNNPSPDKAPHVINNSWYCSEQEGCNASNLQVMNLAVSHLRLAGTVVVVSAGNFGGCGTIANPAIFESSFTVGATAINDTIAGFSSRGPAILDGSNRLKPNVSAPGVGVRSSVPGGNYSSFSGTSMAGPHVAGLVALIISANPDLAGQVDVIEQIIEQTAVPKTTDQQCGEIPGSQVPNHTYGYGRVDALAAVQAALALIPSDVSVKKLSIALKVYPNPVGSQLFLEIENASSSLLFQLFDVNGRLVHEKNWSSEGRITDAINLEAKSKGVYFYRLLDGTGVLTGMVAKQ
ncbi:MAG: S8 family serine peptidase [Saprospiraceae bacterium]|nr:S8 family serine peptidase [Saprospiraceae bacterium]